jgi:hypothetical protein
MSGKCVLVIIFLLIFIVLLFPVSAQQIFDEMNLIDISNEQGIKSTIIRDPEQALLIVKTQISSMRVQSNNIIHKSEQVSPGTWHILLAPGTHRISFQAEQFISMQKRFYFNAKEVKGVRIRVIPATQRKEEKNTGIVVIKSEPDSAQVYLNDQYYGVTPYLGKILSGRYKLQLKKEPFLPYEQAIIILSNETLPVNIQLSRSLGTIDVASKPTGAEIKLDGRIIGKTPLQFSRIEMGRHRLMASLENFHTIELDFDLSKEKSSQTFNLSLRPKQAKLKIDGQPLNALVKINDTERGALPLDTMTMKYGIYDLHISKPGFYAYDERISIDKTEPYSLDIKLKPKSKYSGLLYSTLLPGSGQIYSGRTMQGFILGGAAITGLTVSIVLHSDYKNKRDQYMADKEVYDKNTDLGIMNELFNKMQNSYDPMEKAYDSSRIVMGITLAVWLYNMVDVILFFPGQEGLYLSSNLQNGRNMLSLNLKF